MKSKRAKVAIIGMGRVGATFAYALSLKRLVNEIAVVDVDADRAEGEAMDLRHGLPLIGPMNIRSGGYEVCKGADIVVITAGAGQKPGQTRLELLENNARVVHSIASGLMELGEAPILIVATNPVDVLTHRLLAQTGFPASRVMGSGTVLDSSRLRQMLAGELHVDVRGVHAHIIGEHGDSELAVWSRANVSGIPLADFCAGRGVTYDAAFRERIQSGVRRAAYEIIARKGSTAYAVGVALCRIVEAIVRDEKSVLTVSTAVKGLYGLPDVSLSLPCVIGEDGIEMIADSPLAEDERKALEASAAVLLQTDASLGAPA
ncbi:L-lactate dehydrogenase [Desulfocurvus sp.]|jgi:L-lactate dehydrogenase|uniref:L-lactate dehydrogenase n=1 Tax=Desulfocurvus sp. TaxID=2871698 RepID=UPI0025B903F2|nr:L-lactate dehydrogenase [Desulfocurvus sp.]MCK9240448.1 L-lactate dehydrogenase [Desulfocurvus sp.]